MTAIHILPENDLKEHKESDDCECNPKIEYVDGGKIVIHNSYDGREFIEQWEAEKTKVTQ